MNKNSNVVQAAKEYREIAKAFVSSAIAENIIPSDCEKAAMHVLCKGNIKTGGNIWTLSTLATDRQFIINRLANSTCNGLVCGTCNGRCDGCRNACYVVKSYRYGSVMFRHGLNTVIKRYNVKGYFDIIRSQLASSRKLPYAIRLHQSGELESLEEFQEMTETAKAFPGTLFYIYTKAYDILTAYFNAGKELPENFTVLVSVWHDIGIAEYNALRIHKGIKAFVYDDFKFDYSVHGLDMACHCPAYDRNGNIDHSITCDKCKLCIRSKASVIACYEH